MALFTAAHDSAGAHAVGRLCPPALESCFWASCEAGGISFPCGIPPQLIPAVLPPLFSASGFPFPAFYPLFTPFTSASAAFSCPMGGCQTYERFQCSIVETPSESSASAGGSLGARGSPVGTERQQHRPALHRGVGSDSRTSLESCSGPWLPSRSASSPRAVSSTDKGSSLHESETVLDLRTLHALDVPLDYANAGKALRRGNKNDSASTQAGPEAAEAAVDRSLSLGTSFRPRSQLFVGTVTKAFKNSSPMADGRQDGDGLALGAAPLPQVHVSRAEGQQGFVQKDDALARGDGRMPLRCKSGDLMWVDARRYEAILRRRRQRAEGLQGPLAVAGEAFNCKPLRCVSRRSLSLLCAHGRPRLVHQSTGAAGGFVGSCSGESEIDLDGPVGGGTELRSLLVATNPCAERQLPYVPDARVPIAISTAAAAALPSAKATAQAATVAAVAKAAEAEAAAAAAREALEAELQAVLAEETGMLPSMDDTAEEDDARNGDSGGVESSLAVRPHRNPAR